MSSEAPPAVPAKPNPVKRLGGVILAPDETLREIAARPDWLVPLVVILLVSLLTNLVALPHIDMETAFREQLEERRVPPEQIDKQMEGYEQIRRFFAPIGVLFLAVMALIIAAILLVAFKVMGGEGSFRQSWSVTLYSWVPQLLKGLLVTFLIYRAGTVDAEELPALLKSNLGFLADPKGSPLLFALLTSIDIFNIWSVILLAIGLSYAHKLSRGKAFGIVVTLWIVVILGKIGLAALQNLGGPS